MSSLNVWVQNQNWVLIDVQGEAAISAQLCIPDIENGWVSFVHREVKLKVLSC